MHLLVLFLLSLSMMVISVLLGAAVGPVNPKSGDPWLPWISWQALSQVLMFALPTLAIAWMYYRPGQRQWLRLDFAGRRWLLALSGVVTMFLLVPITDWLTTWNDAMHLPVALKSVEESLRNAGEQSQGMLQLLMSEENPWVCLLFVALVPAVCEELFFRAGIQNLLLRWWSPVRADGTSSAVGLHAAVWVTAAVFSLAHFEVFAFLPRLLLGALLGYLYVGGGSLVVNGEEKQSDRSRFGYMAMVDDRMVIGVESRREEVKDYVMKNGGSYFRQYILVSNRVIPSQFELHGKVERKAIGRMNIGGKERLYFISTRNKETLWDFADALREYGFIDAIYITGGTDYCYYRTADGQRHDIGDINDYPHKKWKGVIPWLVLRKR